MNETTFRNKVKLSLEKTGGMVIRINDVPGTGLRYSDLIWIYHGSVVFIECKVIKNKTSEQVYTIRQGSIATPGQLVSNYIVQNANALYVYAMHFTEDEQTLIAFYEHDDKIYSPIEAGDLVPTVAMPLDEFLNFCTKYLNEKTSSLVSFKTVVLKR